MNIRPVDRGRAGIRCGLLDECGNSVYEVEIPRDLENSGSVVVVIHPESSAISLNCTYIEIDWSVAAASTIRYPFYLLLDLGEEGDSSRSAGISCGNDNQ